MNRAKTTLLAIVSCIVIVGSVRAQDDILLNLNKGPMLPGDATLVWTGGVPNFDVFRSPSPAGVTNPSNILLVTGGRQTVDSLVPPPGGLFCYEVTSVGPCDPLNPAAVCGPGERCYPTEDGLSNCMGPVGAGAACSACTSDASCAPIDVCVNGGLCEQWCRHGGFHDCPGGTCFNTVPSLSVGTQQYGVCGCP